MKPANDFYKSVLKNGGKCKPCYKEYNHKRYVRNRAKLVKQTREWQAANPLKFKLIYLTCTRIHMAIPAGKHPPPLAMLGCTYEDLLKHLGGSIDKGQEIDHIVPIALYDFVRDPQDMPQDMYAAFHWSNTQLLSKEENSKKGAHLPPIEQLAELAHVWPTSWGPLLEKLGAHEAAELLHKLRPGATNDDDW